MQRKKIITTSIIAIIFIIIATSCSKKTTYEKYVDFEDGIWASEQVADFEFSVEDTTSLNNVYINLRHSDKFKYCNLWIFVRSWAPNGSNEIDTLEYILADDRGLWLGNGVGDVKDVKLAWKKNVRFAIPGKYHVELTQGMRSDSLSGISNIGLSIERSNEIKE